MDFMSFAVVHMQKFKTNGVKGIQFHNQRERESKTNPDINKDLSHLNYDLHNHDPIDYNKTVKGIIDNNVITTRAIRKDAIVMCNFIVTSDKKFFDGLSDQEQKKFFEKSYEFFKERYGEEKIIAAPVHLDETTPHMHLSLVPVTDDNKLSAKRLFDRKELRSIQDDFPKFIQDQGFDLKRGIDAQGKNKHIEIQKLKAMEFENKVKVLQNKKNTLQNDLKALKSDLNKIKSTEIQMDDINSIQGKYLPLSKENMIIKTSDFEKLKSAAKQSTLFRNEAESLIQDKKILQEDIAKLYKSRNELLVENKSLKNKVSQFEEEKKLFKKEYGFVVNYLKNTEQIEKATEDIVKQREDEKILEKELEKEAQKNKVIQKNFDELEL